MQATQRRTESRRKKIRETRAKTASETQIERKDSSADMDGLPGTSFVSVSYLSFTRELRVSTWHLPYSSTRMTVTLMAF